MALADLPHIVVHSADMCTVLFSALAALAVHSGTSAVALQHCSARSGPAEPFQNSQTCQLPTQYKTNIIMETLGQRV